MYQLDKPDNVVEFLENTVAKYPQRPFLGEKNKNGEYEWINYADFGKRVDNCRAGLAQLGIKKDDAVGIISNNSTDWAVGFFATGGLAARYVPMYEAELVQVWKYIINDADIKVLFVSKKEILNKIKDIISASPKLEKVILMEGDGPDTLKELERKGAEKPVASIKPDQSVIGVLIYTSGTTGDPKGVLLSQGNLSSNSHARIKMFSRFDEDERTLNILPWAHVYGLGEMITFMQIGASMGLAESATTIVDDIVKVKPTFLIAVPRVFNRVYDGLITMVNEKGGLAKKLFDMGVENGKKKRELAAQGKSSFGANFKFAIADKIVFSKVRAKLGGRLKGSMTGSAAMNVEISHFFWDIGIPLYDVYGLTETTPAATMNGLDAWRIGSVGKAIDKCKIVIDQSVVEPSAKDGEIIIYGPNVMQGYHKKPEATAAVMTSDGGFRTGDRGRLDADGFLYITGRIKEQFKLENGKYVFPAAIEEDIKLNHYIENAMIYGEGRAYNVCIVIPDFIALKKWAEKNNLPAEPAELIKRKECTDFLEKEIIDTIKGSYGSYELPKKFIFATEPFTLENGTLTQTMKLKRRVVFDKYKDQIEASYK
ncbi:MAG TPA: long-chain fatty acid--CoA ligase [Spirochaetota bacterium]|nr:long-chain fatty acid--CoA ligase [Spirochaetota bacterium]HNT12339.1 long-chain fatty acid--CoA ligase [Spirochaetota bacterium]